MSNSRIKEEYRSKLLSIEEAAKQIQSGNVLSVPPSPGEPRALCAAIAKRVEKGELENIAVHNIYTFGAENPIWSPKLKGKVIPSPLFVTTAQRWAIDEGAGDFTPVYYTDCPTLYERGHLPLDVFVAEVSPMDEHGYFSFGCGVSNSQSCARVAKKVILQANPNQPRVFGDSFIHISDVDCVVEDNQPLPEIPNIPITDNDRKIASYIAELIPDGATLQVGVGGVPNAVCTLLKDKRDLGIHTELIGDTILDLIECGAVTNRKKNINRGKSVFTFALGSRRLYDFINNNPGVASYQVDYTNDPYVIAQHDNVIAMNATLQVDLTGQCCSESIGTRQFSAVGGQADFARGAFLSKGGKSFLCIYSTARNGELSSIVPCLLPGAGVSTQKQSIMYIVTEYGVAKMTGKTLRERARQLIDIAHPDFREELKAEARKRKIM
jgi:acyl-CoA hydrolase